MRFSDYITTALKNLTRQKARTFLTIVAITIGSLSLILMASIIISIRQSLYDQFQKLGAFSLVSVMKDPNSVRTDQLIGNNGDPSEGKLIDDVALASLRALPHVAEATPILTPWINTMRLDGGEKKTWGNVMGFDPANDVFNVDIAFGRKLQSGDMDRIVISSRFIEDIGYAEDPEELIGQKVLLTFKSGPGSGPDWGPPPEQPPANADKAWYESQSNKGIEVPAEIVGIISSGPIDSGQSYISLAWARRLNVQVRWEWDQTQQEAQKRAQEECQREARFGEKNCQQSVFDQSSMKLVKDDQFTRAGYSSVVIKVDDQANIDTVASGVKDLGYGANTAKAMLEQINKILLMISLILALIGGISLFVASIGIINTMIMATYERTREIGVMRACGATRGTIRKLFTFEAGLLGFIGGAISLGIAMGLGLVARLLINRFDTSLSAIPIDRIGQFPWWLILAVITFTTLIGMLAGLVPAVRASRMNPVEALRYE